MSDFAQADGLDEGFSDKTNIKVVGVGGAGGNAVNRMIAEQLKGVQFIAVNTDAKDLMRSEADVKIALTDPQSRGLGAGADPERGAKAAQDHQSDIEEALKGADMVFVTCGEGGGTGTGASPLVARCAHQQGALTIAVVTRPFSFEGARRAASAESGIENLRKEVDAIIVIPNDRLRDLSDHQMTVIEAFRAADKALLDGVQGVTDLFSMNSYINVDFSDVRSILKDSGTALFGIGTARGEDRAVQAAEIAISSPLLEESIEGANGALVNVAGGKEMTLEEASAAVEMVQKVIHPQASIIWGLVLDDAYGDEVRVTVIAAGFDDKPKPDPDAEPARPLTQSQPAQQRPAAQHTARPAQTSTQGQSSAASATQRPAAQQSPSFAPAQQRPAAQARPVAQPQPAQQRPVVQPVAQQPVVQPTQPTIPTIQPVHLTQEQPVVQPVAQSTQDQPAVQPSTGVQPAVRASQKPVEPYDNTNSDIDIPAFLR